MACPVWVFSWKLIVQLHNWCFVLPNPHVSQQLVAGLKYTFTVTMGRTSCRKDRANEVCAVYTDPERAQVITLFMNYILNSQALQCRNVINDITFDLIYSIYLMRNSWILVIAVIIFESLGKAKVIWGVICTVTPYPNVKLVARCLKCLHLFYVDYIRVTDTYTLSSQRVNMYLSNWQWHHLKYSSLCNLHWIVLLRFLNVFFLLFLFLSVLCALSPWWSKPGLISPNCWARNVFVSKS